MHVSRRESGKNTATTAMMLQKKSFVSILIDISILLTTLAQLEQCSSLLNSDKWKRVNKPLSLTSTHVMRLHVHLRVVFPSQLIRPGADEKNSNYCSPLRRW